jgi:hypothetical protein
MITNLSDSIGGGNLATTMAIGHLVTAITIIMIHPKVLRNHKKRILNPPQTIVPKIATTEQQVTEVEQVNETPVVDENENRGQVIDLDDLEFSDDSVESMD